MNTKKNGLQKLAKSPEQEIELLLKKNKVTHNDLNELSKGARVKLAEVLTEKLNTLRGEELDELHGKIELITDKSTKNSMWEKNHMDITAAISEMMQKFGRMPSNYEIAAQTGLSRQTVTKHIAEFKENPVYLSHIQSFQFMGHKLLAKVFKLAVNGDIKAAKLYFDIIGGIPGQPQPSASVYNQNNYIQINGTIISQEAIKQLPEPQLKEFEKVLKGVLHIPN